MGNIKIWVANKTANLIPQDEAFGTRLEICDKITPTFYFTPHWKNRTFVGLHFFSGTRVRLDVFHRLSHLKVGSLVLVADPQHQVTQHPQPSELLHGLEAPGGVCLHRVVQVSGSMHGWHCDGREIRVARGPSLSHRAMHSGSRSTSDFSSELNNNNKKKRLSLCSLFKVRRASFRFYPIGVRILTWAKVLSILISSRVQRPEFLGCSILLAAVVELHYRCKFRHLESVRRAVRRRYPLATPTADRNPAWNVLNSHGWPHRNTSRLLPQRHAPAPTWRTAAGASISKDPWPVSQSSSEA